MCVYMYTVPMYIGQKRTLDTLELELQVFVGLHVGAGTKPRPSGRAASTHNHWAISVALHFQIFKTKMYSSLL